MRKTVVVVNPRSAGGALARRWPEIARVLRSELGEIEAVLTTGPRDATRLAREAIAGGAELVVAVGGDGTIHEVANGFFDESGKPAGNGAAFGILPFGTGGDFRRTAGIPREIEAAAAVLRAHKTRAIDVGQLEYRKHGGGTGRSMFINSASAGMAGLVDKVANSSSKIAGGQISFFLATLRASLQYKNPPVRIVFDGKESEPFETKITNVAVTNGRYFGGGMKVAPDAELDDGLFDVVTVGDLTRFEATLSFPRLYKGSHLQMSKVSVKRAARVDMLPLDGSDVLLDVDGEQLGILPATFTVVPRALNLVVPHG